MRKMQNSDFCFGLIEEFYSMMPSEISVLINYPVACPQNIMFIRTGKYIARQSGSQVLILTKNTNFNKNNISS